MLAYVDMLRNQEDVVNFQSRENLCGSKTYNENDRFEEQQKKKKKKKIYSM